MSVALVGAGTHELVDARSASRFAGTDPEPRPGLASGHIPGARSLPQGQLFNADNSWKRGEALRAEFDAAGIDLAKPMVTSCGPGVTAAVLPFGAHLLGKGRIVRIYDGSWTNGAPIRTPQSDRGGMTGKKPDTQGSSRPAGSEKYTSGIVNLLRLSRLDRPFDSVADMHAANRRATHFFITAATARRRPGRCATR